MPLVLIVDDREDVRTALEVLLDVHGIEALAVATPAEARVRVQEGGVGVVLQDMNFREGTTSGAEGVELFHALRAIDGTLPIVLMTAWTSLETAVRLVKEGAVDYLAKPWDDDRLVTTVRTHLRLRALSDENARLARIAGSAREELARSHDLCGLEYASSAMHELVLLALRIAPSNAPVLITGPNGSGKERLAEIVQANSRRRSAPFVRINAGALPESLLEAELFGAEPGAFTGAQKARVGKFEAADGGTLFLDEIGNLSLAGQMKLLRVLQTGEVTRLGGNQVRRVDVRVVSATNEDLPTAIAERRFREDLYFRLNVVELAVPPLSRRPEDVLPLARWFAARPGADGPALPLSAKSEEALLAHPFPGNVRELENRVTRARLVAGGPAIEPADLGLGEGSATAIRPGDDAAPGSERAQLEAALLREGGSVSRVASALGVSRQALYRKMERLGVVLERKPRGGAP